MDFQRHLAWVHYRLGVASEKLPDSSGDAKASAANHFAEALKLRAALANLDSKDIQGRIEYMLALGRAGKGDDAVKLANGLVKQSPDDQRVLYQAVCGFALASTSAADPPATRTRAFGILSKLIDNGYRDRAWLAMEPDLEPIRTDGRFTKLLRDIPKALAD